MITAKDKFSSFLKSKGLKFTTERRAILEGVFSFHKHFDVDQLYDKLQRQGEHISRASIYRTIPLLIKSGLIAESLRCQGRVSYEHIFGHEHHDHMLCIKCGKVIEFRNKEIEELQEEVCKEYGFMALEHRLGIRGYCKRCRKKR